ncbi:MAG: hypothetical protein O2860_11945 [Chloroflexi bacterium]|nr:hypothetical protein [Chloroflexota bacterium]
MSELVLGRSDSLHQNHLDVERVHQPDSLAMLAALRVVLGLPKQLATGRPQDLLSSDQSSHRYVPDRTSPNGNRGRGQEGTE